MTGGSSGEKRNSKMCKGINETQQRQKRMQKKILPKLWIDQETIPESSPKSGMTSEVEDVPQGSAEPLSRVYNASSYEYRTFNSDKATLHTSIMSHRWSSLVAGELSNSQPTGDNFEPLPADSKQLLASCLLTALSGQPSLLRTWNEYWLT